MSKRFFVLLLALLFLVGCSQSSVPSGSDIFTEQSVREDIDFEFKSLDNYLFSMVFDPRPDALTQLSFGFNIPDGFDADWKGDSEYDAHYAIFEESSQKHIASIRVNTPPPNLAAYYNTDNPNEILDNMISQFFETENAYSGLKSSIVEGFEYDLLVDWTGTALGYSAYYMEFINPDSQSHALRFYLSNDELDETFYAFEFKADSPMDDQEQIDLLRSILFSLHEV